LIFIGAVGGQFFLVLQAVFLGAEVSGFVSAAGSQFFLALWMVIFSWHCGQWFCWHCRW